jgi:hypothetical protein
MVEVKKILCIYLFYMMIDNIVRFQKVNYLHYIQDKKKSPFSFIHFILPSKIHKTKSGFYSILFNKAVYEIFIDREKRGQGKGSRMSEKLVKKYPLIICNSDTLEKFENVYKKDNVNYGKLYHILYKK